MNGLDSKVECRYNLRHELRVWVNGALVFVKYHERRVSCKTLFIQATVPKMLFSSLSIISVVAKGSEGETH